MTRNALLATAVLALLLAHPADAERRSFGGGGSNYQSNGHFGIGLELGAPSGFNGKYFLTPSTALNFGLGWLYDSYYRDGDGFHLYLDHLWHPVQFVENPTFKLPLFVGVGGRFWHFEDCYHDACGDSYSALGVRVPVGVTFDFNKIPLDAFAQITFVADLFFGDYRDRFGPHFEGSIGARYWFD